MDVIENPCSVRSLQANWELSKTCFISFVGCLTSARCFISFAGCLTSTHCFILFVGCLTSTPLHFLSRMLDIHTSCWQQSSVQHMVGGGGGAGGNTPSAAPGHSTPRPAVFTGVFFPRVSWLSYSTTRTVCTGGFFPMLSWPASRRNFSCSPAALANLRAVAGPIVCCKWKQTKPVRQ